MVNLGFMELPLTGPMGMVHAGGGLAVALTCTIGVVMYALSKHPVLLGAAIDVKHVSIREACSNSILASCGWIVVYYNMIGVNVMLTMCSGPWKMIPESKIDKSKLLAGASRFAGNSAEHAVVFMVALWMYTIFVDATTGGFLGIAYVIQRLVYPVVYMTQGAFNFRFEYVTQAGYGMIGVMVVGNVVTAMGGDWVAMLTKQPVLYSGLSCAGAVLLFLPAVPFGPVYAPLHYAFHRAFFAPDASYGLLDEK
eukprot:TRINITY_DN21741_c0_g1_i2.p1 TRINITY_DN21741_c0_g1~~TRINITY_DN21741_c0_g1_i2.p1  ORF type:complete len:271 (+),score=31.61 TRINITY_DN21741_c0_g1_i2:60-815(+)